MGTYPLDVWYTETSLLISCGKLFSLATKNRGGGGGGGGPWRPELLGGTLDPFTKTYIVIENFEVQNDIVPEIMRDVLGLKEPPYNQSSKSLNATKC